MRPPNEKQALREVVDRLADLLSMPSVRMREGREIDAIADLGSLKFVIEWKGVSSLAQVSRAIEQVRQYAIAIGEGLEPLVAVPFMGPVGREYCREAGVSWLDLSGNARINVPGIRVRVDGQPNRFKRTGRPASVFAPKSSRIARWLLLHPGDFITQRELARATGMDEGFTSRIVAKLEKDELVVRGPAGAVRARDPDLLLDAWREDYDFSKHRVVKGHVAARSGDAVLRKVSEELRRAETDHAATGLAAAWLLTRFAAFRVVSIYILDFPASESLDRLGFREEAAGANLWLVTPSDEGVFRGASDREGIPCVHAIQSYLDLKVHPERAAEAAEHLRAELLTWRSDA